MRKQTAAALLTVGLITGGGVALMVPTSAFAATSTTGSSDTSATDRAASRLSAVKDALKGPVSDGTITQTQADQVATTLSTADIGGHGGGHGGDRVSPEATAKVIGITVDQLQTAQRAGQTLTQIAAAHNVSKADLITGLVTAARTELAAQVKSGELTQAQADQLTATLTDRVTARVDQTGRGFGHGHHGDRDDSSPSTATPAPSASSS